MNTNNINQQALEPVSNITTQAAKPVSAFKKNAAKAAKTAGAGAGIIAAGIATSLASYFIIDIINNEIDKKKAIRLQKEDRILNGPMTIEKAKIIIQEYYPGINRSEKKRLINDLYYGRIPDPTMKTPQDSTEATKILSE